MTENNEELIEKVETNNYKCPECGAPMGYNPTRDSLSCEYCGKVINLSENNSSFEEDFFNVKEEDLNWQNETQVVKCENCGSENVLSKREISLTCPFCSSKQVVSYDAIAGMKPNRVIPFKVSVDNAKEIYSKIMKRKIFAPKKAKQMLLDIAVRGVYIPSWTYDSQTFSSYHGRLGKHYTTTVGSGNNKRTVTKTRYFRIKGTKFVTFDDILINSGKSMAQNDLNRIQPFDTNNALEFEEAYLAGFSAEHYSKDVKTGFKDAKETMDANIRRAILRDYSYDVVDYLKVTTAHEKVTYKYVLLPVWFGTLEYLQKKYRFVINGESGKLSGKFPVSILKVLILIFGIIILSIIMLLLVGEFGV